MLKERSEKTFPKGENKDLKKLTIKKTLTFINGLDEILSGGLPTKRSTLIVGEPGCGKTVLGIEFILQGSEKWRTRDLFRI